MRKILFSFALVILLVFVVGSCKKAEADTETQSATDNAIAEGEFMDLAPTTSNKAINKPGVSGLKITDIAQTCVYDTVFSKVYDDDAEILTSQDTSTTGGLALWPRLYEINFGGCAGADGKVRTGKLKVVMYQRWSKSLETAQVGTKQKMKIKFDALHPYKVDDVLYSADSITLIREKTLSGTASEIKIYKGVCSHGWTINWSADRKVEFDLDTDGNILSTKVTGTANGINRKGDSFSTVITSPLVKKADCKWIQSGVVDITPSGKATRTIDYGTSGCDNKATLTIKGNTFNFEIPDK